MQLDPSSNFPNGFGFLKHGCYNRLNYYPVSIWKHITYEWIYQIHTIYWQLRESVYGGRGTWDKDAMTVSQEARWWELHRGNKEQFSTSLKFRKDSHIVEPSMGSWQDLSPMWPLVSGSKRTLPLRNFSWQSQFAHLKVFSVFNVYIKIPLQTYQRNICMSTHSYMYKDIYCSSLREWKTENNINLSSSNWVY